MRKTQTPPASDPAKTIPIIVNDLPENEIETDEFSWLDDFTETSNIVSIRLHRFKDDQKFTAKGFPPFLRSYETPPSHDEIKAEFGGGNFMLVVKMRSDDTPSGFTLKKPIFSIEGPPKVPGGADSAGDIQNSAIQAPGAAFNDPGGIIGTIKLLKEIGLFPAQNPQPAGDTALILESMKATNTMILEMIKSKSGADPVQTQILTTLLNKALEKSGGDLEQFEKYATIISKLERGGADESEAVSLIKALAPSLLPMFMQRKQQQAPGRIPAPRQQQLLPENPGHLPPGNNGAAVQPPADLSSAILSELQKLNSRIDTIEARQNIDYDLLDEIENKLTGESPQDPAAVYQYHKSAGDVQDLKEYNLYLSEIGLPPLIFQPADNNVIELTETENLNQNTDMFNFLNGGFNLEKFIQGLKGANFDERVTTLKQAANIFTQNQIYNFCLKNEIVSDVKDFNQYMRAAGLPDLTE